MSIFRAVSTEGAKMGSLGKILGKKLEREAGYNSCKTHTVFDTKYIQF